jgi:hypothetical protein
MIAPPMHSSTIPPIFQITLLLFVLCGSVRIPRFLQSTPVQLLDEIDDVEITDNDSRPQYRNYDHYNDNYQNHNLLSHGLSFMRKSMLLEQ